MDTPGGRGIRETILPSYKRSRKRTPQALLQQLPIIVEALKVLRIPCIDSPKYEADDLIATYARVASQQGCRVTIVSPDKDLLQLVRNSDNRTNSGSVGVFDPSKKKMLHRGEVVCVCSTQSFLATITYSVHVDHQAAWCGAITATGVPHIDGTQK